MRHTFTPRAPSRTVLRLTSGLGAGLLAVLLTTSSACQAWELEGTKTLTAHTRDDQHLVLGTLTFTPRPDGAVGYTLALDTTRFTDHFLSMKEFKCLQASEAAGGEVACHVPYPYASPRTVRRNTDGSVDLRWLEHDLLFLFKQPKEFGAKLWNGLYYRFTLTPQGLVGTPQAIDLNLISAPPDRPELPPYRPALRDDIPVGVRWLERLTVQ